MITIYSIKKSEMANRPNGEVFYLLELRGLSTDEKPKTIENGTIENGSVFIEIDTQDVYIYDLENEVWLPNGDTQSDSEDTREEKKLDEIVEQIEEKKVEENVEPIEELER